MKNNFESCDWFLNSPLRCHTIGATLSIALLTAITWIWSNADFFAKDNRYTNTQIEEAVRLVSNADKIRSDLAAEKKLDDLNKHRISEIKRWLPDEPSWDQTNQRVRDLAESADVQLTAVDKGARHIGSRIGVQTVACELQGSYANICELLSKIASNQKPIWCDSIRIQRTPKELRDKVECTATVSMRVPFLVGDTIAAKLIPVKKPQKHDG